MTGADIIYPIIKETEFGFNSKGSNMLVSKILQRFAALLVRSVCFSVELRGPGMVYRLTVDDSGNF